MGFRLSCKCVNNKDISFYGTKLYGYYKDIDKLASIKYLESLGLREKFEMSDNETFEQFFSYATCTCDVILNHDQFLIFMELYCFDWNFTVDKTHFINKGFDNFLEDEDIKKLIDSNDNIIMEWC